MNKKRLIHEPLIVVVRLRAQGPRLQRARVVVVEALRSENCVFIYDFPKNIDKNERYLIGSSRHFHGAIGLIVAN